MSKILLLLAQDLFLKRVREEKHEKNRLKKKAATCHVSRLETK